jgi:dephospho-CoA kinase
VIVLGLTGSIGMGKTTTARLFAEEGVPVWDADAVVHKLYGPQGGAVAGVGEAFPGVVGPGGVDRRALGSQVAADPRLLARLEAIVHPLVRDDRERFLDEAEARGEPLVVAEVQLLFETGADQMVDGVVVVTADPEVQKARVMSRPGMTAEKFEALKGRQMSDADKRARADFVIDTGSGIETARQQVRAVIAAVTQPGWTSPKRG